MNRERAKEWIPIFEAFSDGNGIQERSISSEWIEAKSIDPTMCPSFYRIKPEPKAIWVNKKTPGTSCMFGSEKSAKEDIVNVNNYEYIAKRFIEAPEE